MCRPTGGGFHGLSLVLVVAIGWSAGMTGRLVAQNQPPSTNPDDTEAIQLARLRPKGQLGAKISSDHTHVTADGVCEGHRELSRTCADVRNNDA